MKNFHIRVLKYTSFVMLVLGPIMAGTLVISNGDKIKSGFQSFDIRSLNTEISLLWVLSVLAAAIGPFLARHFQALQDRHRLSDAVFINTYSKTLANAINDLEDVRDHQKTLVLVQRALLQAMANLTVYYRGLRPKSNLNVNLMVPIAPHQVNEEDVHFLEHDGLEKCRWVLRIEEWAWSEPEVPGSFALPVYDPEGDWNNRNLFGAPLAFVRREPEIIDNTTGSLPWPSGVSSSVRVRLTGYFQERKKKKILRSFVSLPGGVDRDGYPLAIVNVQWNKKNVLGRKPGLPIDLLLPLLLILAHMRRVSNRVGGLP
jgi:hypothetical protein